MQKEVSLTTFFENKEIFVTGGSGFVGKALIEKLLRSCNGLKMIFVLMRPKKGVSPEERINKMTENLVFKVLRQQNPNFFKKLQVIEGDCSELNLGIKEKDFDRLKNVNIIFHSAASTRFDEPLKKDLILNTRGTREVCRLAEKLKNLESFVHISTAFVNPKNLNMKETIYETSYDWRDYIKMAENLDAEVIDTLTDKLTNSSVNTYVFTKNLAEHVCLHYKNEKNLPISIVRPSIITCAEVEPFPGWMDPYNGAIMMLFAYGSGIRRTLYCYEGNGLNCIPVDICVKSIIVAAWKKWNDLHIKNQLNTLEIYNSASVKVQTFEMIKINGFKVTKDFPFKYAIWTTICIRSTHKHFINALIYLLQIFPALILDGLLKVCGKSPILMKIQRKLWIYVNAFEYFTINNFHFDTTNFNNLNRNLAKVDRNDFFMDERIKSDYEYFKLSYIEACKITFNQTEDENESVKFRHKIFETLHNLILFVCCGSFVYYSGQYLLKLF